MGGIVAPTQQQGRRGRLRGWPGGITFSRSVGDADCGDWLVSDPSCYFIQYKNNIDVVVSSDGCVTTIHPYSTPCTSSLCRAAPHSEIGRHPHQCRILQHRTTYRPLRSYPCDRGKQVVGIPVPESPLSKPTSLCLSSATACGNGCRFQLCRRYCSCQTVPSVLQTIW